MQTEKNKRASVLFWLLTVICMGLIFYFSSRTASESSEQSASILEWITKIFGENNFTDFIVRKCAHCLEFTGLCLLFNCALLYTYGKQKIPYAIAFSSLYAISDEVHQIFIEGRSCELRDWGIDTLGALLGSLGFVILFYIVKKIVDKHKKAIDIADMCI